MSRLYELDFLPIKQYKYEFFTLFVRFVTLGIGIFTRSLFKVKKFCRNKTDNSIPKKIKYLILLCYSDAKTESKELIHIANACSGLKGYF